MFMEAYKKAISVILSKPWVLWGLSLMYGLLVCLTGIFVGVIPAVACIITYILGAGMSKIYLDGLKGKDVSSEQLFAGFAGKWGRIAGAIAWRDLWIFIWFLIPIAGPIIAIVKSYEYRFVLYIVMTRPEVTATEALKLSMKETDGKKGQMFLADIVWTLGIFAAYLVLALVMGIFGMIPFIGPLFVMAGAFIMLAGYIVIFAFAGIFTGLYQAYFYEYKEPEEVKPVEEKPVEVIAE